MAALGEDGGKTKTVCTLTFLVSWHLRQFCCVESNYPAPLIIKHVTFTTFWPVSPYLYPHFGPFLASFWTLLRPDVCKSRTCLIFHDNIVIILLCSFDCEWFMIEQPYLKVHFVSFFHILLQFAPFEPPLRPPKLCCNLEIEYRSSQVSLLPD